MAKAEFSIIIVKFYFFVDTACEVWRGNGRNNLSVETLIIYVIMVKHMSRKSTKLLNNLTKFVT